MDIDVAIQLDDDSAPSLLERCAAEFFPNEDAVAAVHDHSSFNVIDTENGLKVDLFVLGAGLLDQMQIQRRISVEIPDLPERLWVTSPECQVLRKLDWYRETGMTSERQWRDVVGILRIQRGHLDYSFLESTAALLELDALLDQAISQTEPQVN